MSRPGRSAGGFTLFELVVVLAILSLVVVLIIPRLPPLGEAALRASTRQVAAQLRYLDERATAGKVSHRLHINLDDQKIDVVRRDVTGEELPSEDPYLRRPVLLDGVLITDVRTERLGTVTSGTVRIAYGPGGLAESLLIHLQLPGGPATTIQALPVSGIVRIAEGYLEEFP